jgi:hypothetical protein
MRDDSVLVDILSLVDVHVSEEIVSTWTDVQCDLAETWACRLHLKASDNSYVRVPKKPEFLIQYTGKRNE